MTTNTHQPYAANQPWRIEAPAPHTPLRDINFTAFAAELDELHAKLKADLGEADLANLRRIDGWGRFCTVAGFTIAVLMAPIWPFPNPLAALFLCMGNVARWAVAHHVQHRGYDAVPNVPKRFRSTVFAHGWRRYLDWPEWMIPPAWCHEHNVLHHYHTGHDDDPDMVERNAWILRMKFLPRPVKWLMLGVFMATWKIVYYAPNTLWAYNQQQRIRATEPKARLGIPTPGNIWRIIVPGERLLLPVTRWGAEYWLRCLLPIALLRFGLIPALFLPLGVQAWQAVLFTVLLAEVFANIHSFLIIAPNHTGDDLHRFDGGLKGRAEFYVQQVTGSVNYTSRNGFTDFLQGYLNFQIEHHLWPDLPALKYRQSTKEVQRICAKYHVPFIEQSVFVRFGKLVQIMLGDRTMKRTDMVLEREQRQATLERAA